MPDSGMSGTWRLLWLDGWLRALTCWLPLLLFGWMTWLFNGGQVREMPVGLVDLDHSAYSRQLARQLDASSAMRLAAEYASPLAGSDALRAGQIYGLVLIPDDFEKQVRQGRQPTLTVFYNSQLLLVGRMLSASMQQSLGTLAAQWSVGRSLVQRPVPLAAIGIAVPLTSQLTALFNLGGNYAQFLLSGLLPALHASTLKYQALNELTLRGVWLMLEAFGDDLPGLIVFENVPRIATRGRHLLDQIVSMLQHYGYATAETTHDCGELGDGLGQSRRRFLLVARLVRKVPPFLYEPPKRGLRSVGDVLQHVPLPGDAVGGPMHRIPALQWKTWVRLAFVEAGSDWRSLNKLAVENGHLRDFLIVPDMHSGMLGVQDWGKHCGTITGKGRPSNGNFAIADPRFAPSAAWKDGQALGVRQWDQHTGAVPGQTGPLQGAYSVADPRHGGPAKHSNEFRIVPWDGAARAVTSAHGTGQVTRDHDQLPVARAILVGCQFHSLSLCSRQRCWHNA